MKKKLLIISILILGSLYFIRYYKINKEIALNYEIERYSINQTIKLDNFTIKIVDFVKERAVKVQKQQVYSLKIKIKSCQNGEIPYAPIIESKLGNGKYYVQTNDIVNFNKNKRTLGLNEQKNLILRYTIPNEDIKKFKLKDKFEFYLPEVLYNNQINKGLKRLVNYRKIVNL